MVIINIWLSLQAVGCKLWDPCTVEWLLETDVHKPSTSFVCWYVLLFVASSPVKPTGSWSFIINYHNYTSEVSLCTALFQYLDCGSSKETEYLFRLSFCKVVHSFIHPQFKYNNYKYSHVTTCTCMYSTSTISPQWVFYRFTKWPAPSWLNTCSSVGQALHQYRRGHTVQYVWISLKPELFQANLLRLLKLHVHTYQ